jgi:hypothetical protein
MQFIRRNLQLFHSQERQAQPGQAELPERRARLEQQRQVPQRVLLRELLLQEQLVEQVQLEQLLVLLLEWRHFPEWQ